MRTKLIIAVFILSSYFGIAQISNGYLLGVYNVNITEWNCTASTNYQTGILYLTSNSVCLIARDSSYTTNHWFYPSIDFSVTPSDSSLHGCVSYNLASGKYFPHDSIHLYIYYYVGTQCAHEYFGKRASFTGIEDLKLLNSFVLVSPQPSNDLVNISFPNNVIKKDPVLFDMSGKNINLNFVKDEGNYKADTEGLASGIYFLSIETTAGILRKKILIVH